MPAVYRPASAGASAIAAAANLLLMQVHELLSELWLPAPRSEVFPFFADAGNLQQLTPPWLDFRIVTSQPIVMAPGTVVDYRLRVHRLPLRWRSRISVWEPPLRFVDEQIRGPYRRWLHEHRFESVDGGTRVVDHVRYALPGGPLAPLLHRWFVRRDVERIFAFRRERLLDCFGRGRRSGAA